MLVNHVAWMMAEPGVPVLAVDLDPQARLTSVLLDEERVEDAARTLPRPRRSPAVRCRAGALRAMVTGARRRAPGGPGRDRVCTGGPVRERRGGHQGGPRGRGPEPRRGQPGRHGGHRPGSGSLGTRSVPAPRPPEPRAHPGAARRRGWGRGWEDRKQRSPGSQLWLPRGAMWPVGCVVWDLASRILDRVGPGELAGEGSVVVEPS